MDSQENAAYVFSQSICAMAEIEGMRAENQAIALLPGQYPVYGQPEFMAIIDKYDIGYNAVISLFRGI